MYTWRSSDGDCGRKSPSSVCVSLGGCRRGRKRSPLTRDSEGQLGEAETSWSWKRKVKESQGGRGRPWALQGGMNAQGSSSLLGCSILPSDPHTSRDSSCCVHSFETWVESSAGGSFPFQSLVRSQTAWPGARLPPAGGLTLL